MADQNRLAAIRQKLGLTQSQMAEALDLSLRTYQEQEALESPRRAYVLAAEHLGRDGGQRIRRRPPGGQNQPGPVGASSGRANELQELVDFPNECMSAEYKSWLNLDDDLQRAGLARHIAALANHGGGYVVFGFNDDLTVAAPNPFPKPVIDRDLVSGVVKRYLEPPFQCDVQQIASRTGSRHPIVVVPPHGLTPICAKAGGPEHKGKAAGIVKGFHYIRKPGPASEAIFTHQEWQPLIRRCAMHERSSIIAAISGALGGRTDNSIPTPDPLLPWHSAADAAFLRKLDGAGEAIPIDLRKARQQFSYLVRVSEPERLKSGQISQILSSVNAEVHDLISTGWSMFYPFTRDGIAPYWNSDPTAEDDEEDFLECSLLGEVTSTSGFDFWRISPLGKATLIREFWEDDPAMKARGTQPGTSLDPDLLGRSLAEVVRHARGFAARFGSAVEVSFRCEWRGLADRHPRRLHGHGFTMGHSTKTDRRVSFGTWPIGELENNWPEIVSALAAPMARSFGVEDDFQPDTLRGQADHWRRL